jgi:carbamoyltransferase
MPTFVLGISAYYHDSAACLLADGEILAAAQEERFTRKKHDAGFPSHAVAFCLEQAGIRAADLDFVAFYDKPILKFHRLLETYLAYAPAGIRSFKNALPIWVGSKLHMRRELTKNLGSRPKNRYVFPEHHESHAASAFFPSPFEDAAIVTMDGVGEWATTSVGVGEGNRIRLTHEIRFPHSLGLLYSAFTYYCGFKVNSGEYKLMGLAPYGTPRFAKVIREKLIDLKDDGSFRMDMSYFNYCQGLTMTSRRFDTLFEGPPRKAESPVTQREMDIAASIQEVTEDIMLRCARHVHARTGLKRLCLAGGVALNCVGNGRILREGPFDDVWIQPAAGDAGGALGVALFIWYQLLGHPREVSAPDAQFGSLLGPRYQDSDIRAYLDSAGAVYTEFESDEALCGAVADLIASERVVGWFQDRMEFGPRALGARSIIGDARSRAMQSTMNLKIKFRESFRPFAPAILKERVGEFFQMRQDEDSPYMLLVAPVQESQRVAENGASAGLTGIEKLKLERSTIPAVTHVDYSVRVQTVDPQRHGRYYQLIKSFESKTGCPVIINTSFNVRGEPIVCTPAQAYRCFMATNMDVLVLERCVLLKDKQPESRLIGREEYLAQFALD